MLSGIPGDDHGRQALFGRPVPLALPAEAHVVSVLVGLALLMLTPRLWRGTRTAVSLTIAALLALVALDIAKGHHAEAAIELCLTVLLGLGRSAFPLGCRNRPRLAVVCAAVGAWGLTYCAVRIAPLTARHVIDRVLHHSTAHAIHFASTRPQLNPDWASLIDALIFCAAVISAAALRSLLRPVAAVNHHVEHQYRAARAIVERHGDDSLSPFLLRPDKALQFAAGGVLAYRVVAGTAIISADPVAPADAAPEVLASFMELARRRGWQVALWGASTHHLGAYRRLGLRTICVGEEAFVDPQRFSLEGRAVRKLRQSVHRVERRGWQVSVYEGRQIDAELETEIDGLEQSWRASHRRLIGFAMGMGAFDADVRPDDLFVLARAPSGRLGATMRFASHCGKLSLDTMHRVGETPNGLNEVLVCRALEVARERGVTQVSLNYAGLAHLVRHEPSRHGLTRWATRWLMVPLHRRFQMERLVRFNEKFSPQWRPRYLVYESRAGLPRTVLRVLQVEGYLPQRPALRHPRGFGALPQPLPSSPRVKGAS